MTEDRGQDIKGLAHVPGREDGELSRISGKRGIGRGMKRSPFARGSWARLRCSQSAGLCRIKRFRSPLPVVLIGEAPDIYRERLPEGRLDPDYCSQLSKPLVRPSECQEGDRLRAPQSTDVKSYAHVPGRAEGRGQRTEVRGRRTEDGGRRATDEGGRRGLVSTRRRRGAGEQ